MKFTDWIKGLLKRGLAITLAAGMILTYCPDLIPEAGQLNDVYAAEDEIIYKNWTSDLDGSDGSNTGDNGIDQTYGGDEDGDDSYWFNDNLGSDDDTTTATTQSTTAQSTTEITPGNADDTSSSLGEGWEDDPLTSGTYDVTEAEETVTKYAITKNASTETFKPFNNMENWMNRAYVEAPENTYSLTVATGATDGSKVLYFCINYKDTNGVSRKQFLFPHVDAFNKSDSLLQYYYGNSASETSSVNPDPYGGIYIFARPVSRGYYNTRKKDDAEYYYYDGTYYEAYRSISYFSDDETVYYMKSDSSFAEFDRSQTVFESDGIYSTYGSKVAEQLNYAIRTVDKTALESFSVQDYAFQTEATIKSIESLDVYIETGSWTVQGMSIYSVDRYKGMEEYGLMSGQTFLDFEGTCIADITKKDQNSQLTLPLTSAGSDTITRITTDTNKQIYVDNHTNTATMSDEDKSKYQKSFASTQSVYTMRMDFSDYYEGGLESFLNPEAKSMSAYDGIVEDIAWELQYKDVHGWTRKVVLPVILSAYGEALQSHKSDVIMGFGQRGDTIAFQGLLPDYSTIVGKPVIYAGPWARNEIAKYGLAPITQTSAMKSNIMNTSSDDIRIAGISIYQGGCMPIIVDGTDTEGNVIPGATIQYLFESEYPMLYQTTDEVKGRLIKPDGSESFKLSNYKSTAPLIAADKGTDQFLVTVKTSENSKTDASSDLSLKLYYKTIDGQTTNTIAYKAKDASNNYMGLWPDVDGKNYLDNSALVAGGQVSFLVEAREFSEFTGAELTVLGDKSWIMDNIEISYVQTYGNRLAYYHTNESAGAKSNFWLERSAITAEVFNLMGTNYTVKDSNGKDLSGDDGEDDTSSVTGTGKVQKLDENGNPMFDEETGEPIYEEYSDTATTHITGDQVFKNGETYTVSFDSDNQIDVRTMDYADVRYSMTWAQTQMNWGFFKVKKNYDIAVEVAPDNDYDDGNGNSGSNNHFYFQLMFKNGNSAYVLANQQLSADGFRSGREETFSISINQDYGDLSGIRIIPEDTSTEAEPFDKLHIDRVKVSEQTSGGSYITYVIDQVGWIDIDYRDELESASTRGQRARTAEELSKIYKVSYKERNVKLLCEVTYEPWSGKYGQFIGSIKAVIAYECASDGKIKTKTVDVVKGMADYLNTTVKSVEATYDADGKPIVAPEGLGTYTDPDTMMRPNHTDRFIIPAISDLKSIKSITFTAKNVAPNLTQWNIGKVCISQVVKDGTLRLTDYDEYVRDMTTRYLCVSTNDKTSENDLEINNIQEIPTFDFTYNEIVWSSEEWATPVTRVPTSENDTVNIYVFPTEGKPADNGADVDAKLNYNLPFSQYESISTPRMSYHVNSLGQSVYYSEGKNAAGFLSAGKLKVHSFSDMTINHAIVQHLREGTVIDTYTYSYLDSTAKNYPTVEPRVNTDWIDSCKEVISLSFGPGTPTQELVSEDHDIAIGFTYTSTIDGGTTEFQSPYVYLTDVGINEISEGLFAEIPFECSFVKEITGYTIAAYGNVTGNINNSCGQVYARNQKTGALTKRSYVSFKEVYALSSHLEPHKPTSKDNYGEESVTPISMTFTTTDISNGNDSTQHASVKMLLKYKKCDGTYPIQAFQDITPYIQDPYTKKSDTSSMGQFSFTELDEDGNPVTEEIVEVEEDNEGFRAGETQTVKFFLTDMGKDLTLVSAIMTPYNAEVTVDNEKATINAVSNEDESTIQTILDEAGNGEDVDLNNSAAADLTQQILENRNATWTISKVECNAGFGSSAPPARDNLNMTFSGYNTSEKNTLRLVNVTMLCDITKNTESKDTATTGNTLQIFAKAEDKLYGNVFVVDPAQGGFKVKAYKVEGSALSEKSDLLSDITTDGFLFTVPTNEGETNVVYRIEVYPTNGPDLITTIDVTVEPTKKEEEEEDKEETDTGDATKQKEDKPAEGTTEATTQSTTESTTEAPKETTSEETNTTPDSSTQNTNSGTDSNSSGEGSGSEGGTGEGSGSEGGSSGEGSGSEGGTGEGSGSEGGSSGEGSGSEGGSGEGSGSGTP